MTNAELKQKIKESRIKMWEVAERVGVSDITLARWLRSEKIFKTTARIKSI